MQHPKHGVGGVAIHGTAAPIAGTAAAPEQVALRTGDRFKGRGGHINTAVGDGRIGGGHIQHRLLVGTDRQWVEAAQGAGDAQGSGRGDHLVKAHLAQQLHRHGVERVLQGIGHGHRPEVTVTEVFRAIVAKTLGRINKYLLRLNTGRHRRGVGEELEGGARGTQGLGGTVELALLKIPTAHHRPHQTGARFHRHQGPL